MNYGTVFGRRSGETLRSRNTVRKATLIYATCEMRAESCRTCAPPAELRSSAFPHYRHIVSAHSRNGPSLTIPNFRHCRSASNESPINAKEHAPLPFTIKIIHREGVKCRKKQTVKEKMPTNLPPGRISNCGRLLGSNFISTTAGLITWQRFMQNCVAASIVTQTSSGHPAKPFLPFSKSSSSFISETGVL